MATIDAHSALIARRIAHDIRRERSLFTPEGMLLPLSTLVVRFGASSRVIKQARLRLTEAGALVRTGRGGRFRIGESGAGRGKPRLRGREAEVGASIFDSIVRGAYSVHRKLPSIKELCAEYHCSATTVAAALKRLTAQGIVRRSGSGYRPIPPAGARKGARILIIGGEQAILPRNGPATVFIRSLEQCAEEAGWPRPEMVLSDNPRDQRLPVSHEIAAFVYIGGGARDWLKRCRTYEGIPLFLFAPSAYINPQLASLYAAMQLATDNERAGFEVGSTVASFGHQHIAFISVLAEKEVRTWGAERRNGLAGVFDGAERSMRWVSMTDRASASPSLPETRHAAMLNSLLKRRGSFPQSLRYDAMNEIWHVIGNLRNLHACRESFRALLKERKITCWVCANDDIACSAWMFLRESGPDAMRRVSLASFDNSYVAYRLQLASYDFRFDKYARELIWNIAAYANRGRRSNATTVVVTGGQLIVRESLRKVDRS
jgi:DNA-binding LacI/PurR family transcriptional regulator